MAIVGDGEPLPVLQRPWSASFALGILAQSATGTIDRGCPLYAARAMLHPTRTGSDPDSWTVA